MGRSSEAADIKEVRPHRWELQVKKLLSTAKRKTEMTTEVTDPIQS